MNFQVILQKTNNVTDRKTLEGAIVPGGRRSRKCNATTFIIRRHLRQMHIRFCPAFRNVRNAAHVLSYACHRPDCA